MFFNQYYEDEMMNESVGLDEFEIEMLAENMTGDYSDALNIIIESDEEFYNLQEKMMKLEHCAIVTEDDELLAEGFSDFKDKVVNGIKKTWEKVKAFFRKLKDWLASVIRSDAKFLAKYKDKLMKAKGTVEIEFLVDKFDRADFGKKIMVLNKMISSNIDPDVSKGTIKDTIAKNMGFKSYSSMKEEVNKSFREKSKLDGPTAYKIIKDYAKDKEKLDNLEKKTDEFFKKAISAAKKDGGDDESGKVAFLKTGCNVVTNFIGIFSSLLKERKNAVRSVAGKLIKNSSDDKDKSKNKRSKSDDEDETKSESFFGFGYGSVLDNF